MRENEEHTRNLSRRYTRMAVISLFLMGLLQGLHTFFFNMFFWPALGFGALALYYRIDANRQEQATTAQWHQPGFPPAPSGTKRLVQLIIVGAVSLLVVISAFTGNKSNASTKETRQHRESDSRQAEQKPSGY